MNERSLNCLWTQIVKSSKKSLMNLRKYTFSTTLILLTATGGALVPFIEQWLWSPAWTLLVFGGVFIVDWATAIGVSFVRGGGFESKKLLITILKGIFFYFLFISLYVFNLVFAGLFPTMEPIETMALLPKIMFLYAMVSTFLSSIKNAAILGIVDNATVAFIYKYIDVYKNQATDRLYYHTEAAKKSP